MFANPTCGAVLGNNLYCSAAAVSSRYAFVHKLVGIGVALKVTVFDSMHYMQPRHNAGNIQQSRAACRKLSVPLRGKALQACT